MTLHCDLCKRTARVLLHPAGDDDAPRLCEHCWDLECRAGDPFLAAVDDTRATAALGVAVSLLGLLVLLALAFS